MAVLLASLAMALVFVPTIGAQIGKPEPIKNLSSKCPQWKVVISVTSAAFLEFM